MTKKVVAIGGGENKRTKPDGSKTPYETGPMDREIIKLTGKQKPNFLFMAHSQLESLDVQNTYFQTMKDIYGGIYGCKCKMLGSNDVLDKKLSEYLVEWADIIYEGGGNTLDMMTLWKNSGFDKILKEAFESGKVMCGVSAGANCWFKACSSDSLKIKYGPGQPLISVDCLGFYEGFFVPHCDEPGRLDSAKELLKERNSTGVFLSNCSALEIVNDSYRIITSDASYHNIEPYALKAYWKSKKYIEEKIDLSPKFKDLGKLMEK